MAIGFGLLRLSPDVFWAMTPREFERAASVLAPKRAKPMGRANLDDLMRRYPD